MTQNAYSVQVIARIATDFPSKFGIPRQSGLVPEAVGEIRFEPKFRDPSAVRELEQFSHLWLLWVFSEFVREGETWSPTVRPPRLGGNRRVGVFATRSPNRPNPIGLSCVRLLGTENTEQYGTVIRVAGADLMDGTPILDIKPYLPFADAHPEASGGFAEAARGHSLRVVLPRELDEILPAQKRDVMLRLLEQDPRPSYHHDPSRVYGFPFAGYEVRFTVDGDVLSVCEIVRLGN